MAKETALVAKTFTMMRTRFAYDALPIILRNEHLNANHRAELILSYNNYLLDPPISVDPAIDYLIEHPRDDIAVKLAGLEVLAAAVSPTKNEKVAEWVVAQLDADDPVVRLVAIKAIAGAHATAAVKPLVKIAGDSAAADT